MPYLIDKSWIPVELFNKLGIYFERNSYMTDSLLLDKIQIVMVGTTHPGNIGAAARAMHNMGLSRLTLVSPNCPVGEIAYARSSGAHQILDNRKTVESLADAVSNCQVVFGASARRRSLTIPQISSTELANFIQNHQSSHQIAIVFGPEHSGLSNDDLDLCHYRLWIPTNPDFASLNIAAAIQVISYELFSSIAGSDEQIESEDVEKQDDLARHQDIDGMIGHFEQAMTSTGFLDPENPGLLLPRLRRLFMRARLSNVEVNIVRGFLKSVLKTR